MQKKQTHWYAATTLLCGCQYKQYYSQYMSQVYLSLFFVFIATMVFRVYALKVNVYIYMLPLGGLGSKDKKPF